MFCFLKQLIYKGHQLFLVLKYNRRMIQGPPVMLPNRYALMMVGKREDTHATSGAYSGICPSLRTMSPSGTRGLAGGSSSA